MVFIFFFWYVLFFSATLIYVIGIKNVPYTSYEIQSAIIYTILCWHLPFFISILIGYALYTWWPSIFAYVVLIGIWVLISPYNYFINFLPETWLGWMVVGDPNFMVTVYNYPLEHMVINDGEFSQRIVAILIVFALFLSIIPHFRKEFKYKIIPVLFCIIAIIIIPLSSSPKISEPFSIWRFMDSGEDSSLEYTISDYKFVINHERDDHNFSYKVDLDIQSDTNQITLALFKEINVKNITFNNRSVSFTRDENLLHVQLPTSQTKGTLMLHAESDEYGDVNPTSFELLSTLPWYPMHPKEALEPYRNGKKETYTVIVNVRNKNQLFSNLASDKEGTFKGKAYGSTILYGPFVETSNIVRPIFISKQDEEKNMLVLDQAITSINKKLETSMILPEKRFIVSTQTELSANLEEVYIRPVGDSLLLEEKVLVTFYLDYIQTIEESYLYEKLFSNYLKYEIDLIREKYGSEVADLVKEKILPMSKEDKEDFLRKIYNEMNGRISSQEVINEMREL